MKNVYNVYYFHLEIRFNILPIFYSKISRAKYVLTTWSKYGWDIGMGLLNFIKLKPIYDCSQKKKKNYSEWKRAGGSVYILISSNHKS